MSTLSKFKDAIFISVLAVPDSVTLGTKPSWETIQLLKAKKPGQLNMVPEDDYIPKPNSKVYFYPNCSVPRYKVREWGKKHKLSITTKADLADARFMSNKTIESLITQSWKAQVSRTMFLSFLMANYDMAEEPFKELYDAISNNSEDYVYLPYDYVHGQQWFYVNTHSPRNAPTATTRTINDLGGQVNPTNIHYSTQKDHKTIVTILSDQILYSESKIIELINEDSAVLDNQMYEQLRIMFLSEDAKNHVLAIETMTNCNLTASLHFVLLLMKEFGNGPIYQSKVRNHVNFKSLLKYLGRHNSYNLNDDQIIQILMDKGVLTMPILKETAKAIKGDWQNQYNSVHFKIQSLTVSDEVKAYFTIAESIEDNVELKTIEN